VSDVSYYLKEITKEYAKSREDIQYKDSMVYIVEKEETEPARILTTIFKDDEDRYYELTVSTPSIEKDDLKSAIQVDYFPVCSSVTLYHHHIRMGILS
jgi:two-component system sensor histidine kinase QseC